MFHFESELRSTLYLQAIIVRKVLLRDIRLLRGEMEFRGSFYMEFRFETFSRRSILYLQVPVEYAWEQNADKGRLIHVIDRGNLL